MLCKARRSKASAKASCEKYRFAYACLSRGERSTDRGSTDQNPQAGRQCHKYKQSIAFVLLLGLVGGNSALASEQESEANAFKRGFYAGTGLGFSQLEPNTNKVDGLRVNDRIAKSGQITLGYDLSKQLSVEIHSADLGSAGLSPSGRINYHIDGISALVYAGGNRDGYKRAGLSAYGRGGFGLLSNSPVGDLPLRTVNANHWLWGAGLEYMHASGFGARAEVISFSKDANYGQLGLIYRFGKKTGATAQTTTPTRITRQVDNESLNTVTVPPPPPPPLPPAPTPESIEPEQQSSDVLVTNACSEFSGVVKGIQFDTGSAHLSASATLVLDDVATTLTQCPETPVFVSAHTDSQGSLRTNQILSQRRAWAVINYLKGIGIDLARMIPRAFGETEPIDTNSTIEGRRNNRRVELHTR